MHCDALCFTAWRVFDTSLNIHDGSSFAGGWRNPETCDEARSMFNVRVYLTNTCLASFDRAVTGACYIAARSDGSSIRLNTRLLQDLTSFDSSAIRLSSLRFARQRFLSEFATFVRNAMKGSIL